MLLVLQLWAEKTACEPFSCFISKPSPQIVVSSNLIKSAIMFNCQN